MQENVSGQKNIFKLTRTLLLGCAFFLTISLFACIFSACSNETITPETIDLQIWVHESKKEVVQELLDDFKATHTDKKYNFTVSAISPYESSLSLSYSPAANADIIEISDNQLKYLIDSDFLLKINSNDDSSAYANRISTGHGYLLYYNKIYFDDEDIKSLDTILNISAKNGKYFCMDLSNGQSLISFFRAAGLNVYSSNESIYCDWNRTNSTFNGLDVANSILSYSNRPGFRNCTEPLFIAGLHEGSIIAGIAGPWDAVYVKNQFVENFGVAMLPCYLVNDVPLQMYSLNGYKALCVNAFTQYPDDAKEVVNYLSSDEAQYRYMQANGDIPANYKNMDLEENSLEAMVIDAYKAQMPFSVQTNLPDAFWIPSGILGTTLASGNADNQDLQELLDETVKDISGH